MPLFKKAEKDTCGFCEASELPVCAHVGGCWNQPNHVPDDHNPERDLQALVNGMATGIIRCAQIFGMPKEMS